MLGGGKEQGNVFKAARYVGIGSILCNNLIICTRNADGGFGNVKITASFSDEQNDIVFADALRVFSTLPKPQESMSTPVYLNGSPTD